jgi:hypothetical protein
LVKSGASLTFTGISTNLTIIKNPINDNGGLALPDDFNLTIQGSSVLSGVKKTIDANTPMTINETQLPGYAFVDITGDGKCPASLGDTITLDEGDDITCTITNDDVSPFLKLVKAVTNDDGGIAQPNDWRLNATANVTTSSTFDNLGGSGDFTAILANNTYTLSEENGPGNYTASNWSCDVGVFTGPDQIQVPLGVNATCTITNDDVPPPSCVPVAGNWTITSDCTLSTSHNSTGNVIIENNAILIIPNGVTLDIDYSTFDLIVRFGGNVLIKLGGVIS